MSLCVCVCVCVCEGVSSVEWQRVGRVSGGWVYVQCRQATLYSSRTTAAITVSPATTLTTTTHHGRPGATSRRRSVPLACIYHTHKHTHVPRTPSHTHTHTRTHTQSAAVLRQNISRAQPVTFILTRCETRVFPVFEKMRNVHLKR